VNPRDANDVPVPTTLHREWTIRAAAAGTHVRCEKPVAPKEADAKAMIEACRNAACRSVQLMDGVIFVHPRRPWVEMIRNVSEIAEVRRNGGSTRS
jgi:xylose dehydrogenase (NAD/NADP)